MKKSKYIRPSILVVKIEATSCMTASDDSFTFKESHPSDEFEYSYEDQTIVQEKVWRD